MKTKTASTLVATTALLLSMLACNLGAPAPQQGDSSQPAQDSRPFLPAAAWTAPSN